MTPNLQDKLSESLQRQAAPVSAGPGLAQAAHRRALRLRLRRRIAAGVACLVALAVAVPIGSNLLGRPTKTEIAPIETPTVRSTKPADPVKQVKTAKVTINLATLPKGEAPQVPWYTRGRLNSPDRDAAATVSGIDSGADVWFVPVENGYLVEDSCCEGIGEMRVKVRMIDHDSTVHDLSAPGLPVVSADGRTVAWTEFDADGSPASATVVLATPDGDELKRQRIGLPGVSPAGFVGGLVLLGYDTADGRASATWDPESGKISVLSTTASSYATDGARYFLASNGDQENPCSTVHDAGRGNRKLWESCDTMLRGFSADGRYVLGSDLSSSTSDGPVVVFDTRTGQRLLEVSGAGQVTSWAAEPNGDILLEAFANEQKTLVRCTLTGRCEAATDRIPQPGGRGKTLTLASRILL